MTIAGKNVDTRSQKLWTECCDKENKLKLKWFIVNQKNIQKLSEPVPPNERNRELQKELEQNRVEIYRNATRMVRPKQSDFINYELDESAMMEPMKPVDKHLKDIFYEANAQNRKLYLKLRSAILPEDRYYFRETTGFNYGWKTRQHAKNTLTSKKFGKVQIIRDTFYRRSGIDHDPEHYRAPAQRSPTVCSE